MDKNQKKARKAKIRLNFLRLNSITAAISGQDDVGYGLILESGKSF